MIKSTKTRSNHWQTDCMALQIEKVKINAESIPLIFHKKLIRIHFCATVSARVHTCISHLAVAGNSKLNKYYSNLYSPIAAV